jgi:hypothetical protein
MTLLVVLPESSGGRIRSFPLSISFQHGSPCSNITWGIKNKTVGGCSSDFVSLHRHDHHYYFHLIYISCHHCFLQTNHSYHYTTPTTNILPFLGSVDAMMKKSDCTTLTNQRPYTQDCTSFLSFTIHIEIGKHISP